MGIVTAAEVKRAIDQNLERMETRLMRQVSVAVAKVAEDHIASVADRDKQIEDLKRQIEELSADPEGSEESSAPQNPEKPPATE